MLFFEKTRKPMIIIMLLSLVAALALDATLHSPVNTNEDGKAVIVTSDLGDVPVQEAGFWDKLKKWVTNAVEIVYCVVTSPPTDWYECF